MHRGPVTPFAMTRATAHSAARSSFAAPVSVPSGYPLADPGLRSCLVVRLFLAQ